MKTPQCQDASDRASALGENAAALLHRRCPGAYIHADTGEVRSCDCDCGCADHAHDSTVDGPLPVLSDPPAADGPTDGTEATKTARKRPQTGDGGRCECGCGAGVRSRFAPGHDAKLKSTLLREARAGDSAAWLEMRIRGWSRLVPDAKLPDSGVRVSAYLAQERMTADRKDSWLAGRVASRGGGPAEGTANQNPADAAPE